MKNMRFRGVILFFLFKTDFLTKYYKKRGVSFGVLRSFH